MRKAIIVLSFFLTFYDSKISYAWISAKYDALTKTNIVESNQQFVISGLCGEVTFTKNMPVNDPSLVSYSLKFKMKTKEHWWFFTPEGALISIDNNQPFKLIPSSIESRVPTTSTSYALHTIMIIPLNIDIVTLIHNANSVSFRIFFSNQGAKDWSPGIILNEWQSAINITE